MYVFQFKSTLIVKEVTVTSGTLGRREITFQLYNLKDYVRIETVAGPPAKLKFVDFDQEQVGSQEIHAREVMLIFFFFFFFFFFF